MLRSPAIIAALALWIPGVAYAHGEDAVVLLLGEIAIVVVCLVASFLALRKLRRTWIGIVGSLAGVALAWTLTADLPYRDNATLIAFVHLGLPLLGVAIAILVARFWPGAPNPATDGNTVGSAPRAPHGARQRER